DRRLGPAFASVTAARRPPAHVVRTPAGAVRRPGADQRRSWANLVRADNTLRRWRGRRSRLSEHGRAAGWAARDGLVRIAQGIAARRPEEGAVVDRRQAMSAWRLRGGSAARGF